MAYETVSYDFSNLLKGIISLVEDDYRKQALCTIKTELNKFFEDFECKEVLFTENTDNEFFGIQIVPKIDYDKIEKLFNCEKDVKFKCYSIEFDSKLFNGDFNAYHILALMIHDINKLNTPKLLKDIVCAIDHISFCKGLEVNEESILDNYAFFTFAVQDTARKMTSAFEYIPCHLSLADDFIRSYGLAEPYEEAMFAVKKCRNNLQDQVCNVSITLNWFVEKYNNLDPHNHKNIADDFKEAIYFTGSKLVRQLMNNVIQRMTTSLDKGFYTALTESAKKKMSLASKIKYGGVKSLEDDVYEYKMKIRNIDSEDDAIYTVRQINNRLGIISDYLENEDLSDADRDRFFKLYDKYDALREELSKKAVYNRKMYGLFVDYNALQQMSGSNYTTMNTYY